MKSGCHVRRGDEKPIPLYMNNFLLSTGIALVGSVWATIGLIKGDELPDDIETSSASGKLKKL